MSRVQLAGIRALTFYKDALTAARRTDALPQLSCVGAACRLYQPEVVRCTNIGGEGTDIDWKCEADLPEALRFGKVDVSCEGWARPGDPYVLKGSCALTYRLAQIPDALRNGNTDHPVGVPAKGERWICLSQTDVATIIFWVLWIFVLAIILIAVLESCFRRRTPSTTASNRPGGGPEPGAGSRWWFPGGRPGYNPGYDSPPPYSKYGNASEATGAQGWRPGFWSGAAMGGLANHLWNNRNNNNQRDRGQPEPAARPRPWNWETRFPSQPDVRARPVYDNSDRGEGSSNLGSMRSSTGFASGTNVR
ncbi:DUF1183-domain-containing protein [Coprinopsis marcescibilis]|uniref:Store-operated calcium entry-associated regulatory factor n=1 Tax=Coprinopsis marcescibilis TaxID=230819 RepID=A0A5C3KK81_COPMA|nr:DUF1183-domain-containing protein [Coprinopsis marcescibilis]